MSTPQVPQVNLADLVEELASQPALFDLEGAPLFAAGDADLLRTASAIASKPDAERYSARNAVRDEKRCLTIAALTLLGWSHRRIAEAVRCDRRLIPRVVERLESSGVLPPLESRVRRAESELREQTIRWAEDMVQSGTISRDAAATLRTLFTGAGILADKQQAANGSGGVNIAMQIGVAVGSDPGDWKTKMATVIASSESGSDAPPCISMGCEESRSIVASVGAAPTRCADPSAAAGPSTHPEPTKRQTPRGGDAGRAS